MALTFDVVEKHSVGDLYMVIVDATFDSSQAIGGEAVDKDDFGLDFRLVHIPDAIARDPDTADNAVLITFDAAASKLIAFWSNSDAADGPLIEVPDTTNLAAYTARLTVYGK